MVRLPLQVRNYRSPLPVLSTTVSRSKIAVTKASRMRVPVSA